MAHCTYIKCYSSKSQENVVVQGSGEPERLPQISEYAGERERH